MAMELAPEALVAAAVTETPLAGLRAHAEAKAVLLKHRRQHRLHGLALQDAARPLHFEDHLREIRGRCP
jgi:hypothetical protein